MLGIFSNHTGAKVYPSDSATAISVSCTSLPVVPVCWLFRHQLSCQYLQSYNPYDVSSNSHGGVTGELKGDLWSNYHHRF